VVTSPIGTLTANSQCHEATARIAAATLFDHLRGDFTHDRSTNATGLLLAE